MSEKDKITVKGIYEYPQTEGFISVKQFMFVYRDGVKHLLLRCTNETPTALRSARFVLTELDRDGEILNVRQLSYKDINADAGATFTANEGIPVSDECVDFKISFIRASAGKYTYKARGKRVNAYYTPDEEKPRLNRFESGFSVDSFEINKFGATSVLMAVALVLAVAALTLMSILSFL